MMWGVHRGPVLAASSLPLLQAAKQVPFSGAISSTGPRPVMRVTMTQPWPQPRCMSVNVDRSAICSSVSSSHRPCNTELIFLRSVVEACMSQMLREQGYSAVCSLACSIQDVGEIVAGCISMFHATCNCALGLEHI